MLGMPQTDAPHQPLPTLHALCSAALKSGKCRLDLRSSSWFTLSAPWTGAAIVNSLQTYCRGTRIRDHTVASVANILGFCNGKKVSHAFTTMVPGFPGLKELVEYARPLGVCVCLCVCVCVCVLQWIMRRFL